MATSRRGRLARNVAAVGLGLMLAAVVAQTYLLAHGEKPSGFGYREVKIDDRRAVAWVAMYGAEPGDLIYIPAIHLGSAYMRGDSDPEISYYITEGAEAKALETGQRPAHVYYERTSAEPRSDGYSWYFAVFLHRPPIPDGKPLPDIPLENRGVVERHDAFGWDGIDDDLLLAGLDLAWVMERGQSLTDEEWAADTAEFSRQVYNDDLLFAIEPYSRPVTEVTDAQVLQASAILSWFLPLAALGTVVAGALWYRSDREPMPVGSTTSLVRISQRSVDHLKGLLVASRLTGVLLATCTAFAGLAIKGYSDSAPIITVYPIQSALGWSPWLVGAIAMLIWLQHHLRIRRTWHATRQLLADFPDWE